MTSPRRPSRPAKTFLCLLAFLFLTGCIPGQTPPTLQPGSITSAAPTPEPALAIYFTRAENQPAAQDPALALEDAVRQASRSVDMAIYNFSLPGLEDALIDASRRDVSVRVVMDSDNLDNHSPARLAAAGIAMTGDRSEASMHNKFAVIDARTVFTGSMNFTSTSAYEDDNNLVRIQSEELAAAYLAEFEEMYTRRIFGAASALEEPLPVLAVEDSGVEVLFSPDGQPARRLLQLLRHSEESIYFLAYSFTSDSLAEAILERAEAGIIVEGIMDTDQARSNTGGEYEHFRQAGLDVRLDGGAGLMHHKVLIIDSEIVVLGSYNFSVNAESRNDENLLILHDSQAAGSFLEEFLRIQSAAYR